MDGEALERAPHNVGAAGARSAWASVADTAFGCYPDEMVSYRHLRPVRNVRPCAQSAIFVVLRCKSKRGTAPRAL
jgi:hypothetical protein